MREIRRARKYLLVLMVIWIPNLCVNLYHALVLPSGSDPYELVVFLVNLSSIQGILNASAYLWGYRPFRRWFKGLACSQYLSYLLFGEDGANRETDYSYLVSDSSAPLTAENLQKKKKKKQWDRLASGEKNVRFGRPNDYDEFRDDILDSDNIETGEESDVDDASGSDTSEASSGCSGDDTVRKPMTRRLNSWFRKKVLSRVMNKNDTERYNGLAESEEIERREAREYRKTPPRRSNTKRDKFGNPIPVRNIQSSKGSLTGRNSGSSRASSTSSRSSGGSKVVLIKDVDINDLIR